MLKRLVISAVALSFLLACYAMYVRVFSRLDLVELAPELHPPKPTGADNRPASQQLDLAHRVAVKVFGPESWQAKADLALYWLESGVFIYSTDYSKVDDVGLRLTPFSLVYMEAAKKGDKKPQIVTMRGNEAVLEFDRPIDILQLGASKPVGGRIQGGVQLQADRGTPDPVDDIAAFMDSLEFRESDKKIWTDSAVRIVSADAVMTGVGGELRLKLLDSEEKPRGKPAFQGVSELVMFKQVQINMLASDQTSLVPGSKPRRGDRPADSDKEPRKNPVGITCQGPFTFNLDDSAAHFHRAVTMIRQTSDSQFDRLFCDDLKIVFDKPEKTDEPAEESASGDVPLKFREAHATGRSVRILSDAQSIEAIGAEMHYDASTGQSVLRGDPDVVATQDTNVIQSRELRFSSSKENDHAAEALGPGNLEARDKETGNVILLAQWTEWARVEPRSDGEQQQQLLSLNGQVQVEQPGRGTFNADHVKVWLVRNDQAAARDGQAKRSGNWQPSRIEGIGNVRTLSAQFEIEAPNRLDMVFEDGEIAARPAEPTESEEDTAGPKLSGRPDKKQRRAKPAEAISQKPPARLRADTLRVRALRDGPRTELVEAWAEGGVDLLQPPENADGHPIVVLGRILHLKRLPNGHHLEVTGSPAHVEINAMKLDGATVGVDQPTGVAWVEGRGAMTMPSDTSLEGAKLDAPSELTITWGTNMFFNGGGAEFGGGVEAKQGLNVLHCERLEVFLTERIDISAPRKSSKTAKISSLICTGSVVLDKSVHENGVLQKHEHLEATMIEFSNTDGQIKAKGPGLVRTYSRGQGSMIGMPTTGNAKPAESRQSNQLQLTEIHFADLMEGNQTQQIANFHGHVQVLHSPVADEHTTVDVDDSPPQAMRLSCEKLELGAERGPGDKPYHVMVGAGNVYVEARDFTGMGDRIAYNEWHDRLIFESRPSSFATLHRQKRRGERPDVTRAYKIIYYRRTGDVKIEGGIMVDFQEREADRRAKETKEQPRK